METFDVVDLVGKRVKVQFSGSGEQDGVIEGVNFVHPGDNKEEIVNFTRFAVRLDSGDSLEVAGQHFSWIEPSAVYP
ncbi:MAG: hypothetical protein ACRYGF_06675 [Janthinobacterium lividum]